MRKPWKFHSLARPKLRQTWNKFNLYNIARAAGREPHVKGRATFFQQKWAAKAKTRGYHGEHIPEKKWVRLFSRRLLSAVDLPPEYLAANDGSEQAAGRGSGLSTSNLTAETYSRVPQPTANSRSLSHPSQRRPGFGDANENLSQHFSNMTPYMQMTFAPLERRLDTAIFRALFASSVRQARQMVIHGAVKVNGKKMVHPSYQLNPGDMFQVQVEKVLYATGQQKEGNANAPLIQAIESVKKQDEDALKKIRAGKAATPAEGEAAEGEEGASAETELTPEEEMKLKHNRLRRLRKIARQILQGDVRALSARQKKDLRLFRDNAQRFMARTDEAKLDSRDLLKELESQMNNLYVNVPEFQKADTGEKAAAAEEAEETAEQKKEREKKQRKRNEFKERVLSKGLEGLKSEKDKLWAHRVMASSQLSKDELRRLAQILKNDEANPIDESKPYVTPWRPRPFMSAFAFIPRYLEVNPNICAAVYLRHPVARKGVAEVPTPFNYLTNQLAHNWYLGRG